MSRTRLLAALTVTALPLFAGCGAFERAAKQEEARQLAWTGPGAGPCAFGGVTPAAEEHCAKVTFGAEGVLAAINAKVRRQHGPEQNCQDHVAAVHRHLARHAGMRAERVYSCPLASRSRGECHVSLAVTLASGERYVVDNGAVVTDTVGADGVATFTAFSDQVDNVLWVGFPPSARDVAAKLPDFPSSTTPSVVSFR